MPTLDWLNRANAFTLSARVPYRLLDPVSVHGDAAGQANNLLIQGDNLEHAQWLCMMLPRLQLLRELLREDGSIWVTIDDNEGHYLKVLMDEVFGRGNFVANVVWQKVFSPKNTARHFSEDHDHVLVFAKNGNLWTPNDMPRPEKLNASYKNTDNDPRGVWTSGDLSARNLSARNFYGAGTYPITCPSGRIIEGPPNGMFWRVSKEKFASMDEDKRIWWGADGNNTPRIKRFLTEVKQGVVPQTLWMNFDVGNTQEAKKEVVAIFGSENFMTPKPERLLQRVLHIATNENDLILDSFLGSGTTAAVAHKMRRRWIGIEMGEHAATHCLPRLQKVIDGEQGGISKAVEWAGGGGFRFMRLGEAVFDEKGSINPAVCFATLAAFVWQQETGSVLDATTARPGTPYLGTHYEIDSYKPPQILPQGMIEPVKKAAFCCYLLYNGILGDKRPASGNVLTRDVLAALLALHATTPDPAAPLLVYGEACRLGAERLKQANVTFKHIPYDVKGR